MHEIERRFLVLDPRAALTWSDENRVDHLSVDRIEQAYLFVNNEIALRVRRASAGPGKERAQLTVKLGTPMGPMIREEFNHAISVELAVRQIEQCPHRIVKTRHRVYRRAAAERWEVDVFEGENAGLVIAELELRDVEENFVLPPWAGLEVTDDPRYTNAALSRHPFTRWT